MTAESPPPLSEAQLEIMSVVWQQQPCTVADVLKTLRARRPLTRNTVHTTMSRLVDKGWLTAEARDGAFVYRAAVEREIAQQSCLEQLMHTVFDGSAEGLLASLLQGQKLSKAEANRIRRMIRQAEENS